MKLAMREAFDRLFPYVRPVLTNAAEITSIAVLQCTVIDGEYAKHCISYMAGVASQERKIQDLEDQVRQLQKKLRQTV